MCIDRPTITYSFTRTHMTRTSMRHSTGCHRSS